MKRLFTFLVAFLLAGGLQAAPADAGSAGGAGSKPAADHCAGAVVCDATFDELSAMGIDMTPIEADYQTELSQALGGGGPLSALAATSSTFSGDYGWNEFYLALNQDGNCNGAKVVDGGHCGWLYNHFTVFSNGSPKASFTTIFEARSGNNDPADHWVPNLGPLPNGDWTSSSPSLGRFHWGWKQGAYSGYTAFTDPAYDPGYFPLDPWDVYNAQGVHRGSFLIHGGTGTHYYTKSETNGCIRIRSEAVSSLRSLWVNYTDNKRDKPGPDQFVYYRAP